jgi:hypothetical protein
LKLAVTWITGNGDDQSPNDHKDEGAQDKEARHSKQGEKADVNGDFKSSAQVCFLGHQLIRGHDGFSRQIRQAFWSIANLCAAETARTQVLSPI